MRFRSFDKLPVLDVVARCGSFSAAADELNLTKGAISYQVRQLESELGFAVFDRRPRGVALTGKGRELLELTQSAFDSIEWKIAALRHAEMRSLTVGLTTYFASRWLSPRLMEFMRTHPGIRLRVQPMINLLDLKGEGVDMAIRWGNGKWNDMAIEPLFACPAFATGNAAALDAIRKRGLQKAFEGFTLLHDRDGSHAWRDWFEATGLTYTERADTLVVPDPNVRVQAVIDGQGVAINDALVDAEIRTGTLHRLSAHELADYGYFLAVPPSAASTPDARAFSAWLKAAA